MEDQLLTFGQRIREIRKSRKLRPSEVAAYSEYKVSKAGLFRIESESRVNPKLATLMALCVALGLRIEIDAEGVLVEAIDGWAPPGRPEGWNEEEHRRVWQMYRDGSVGDIEGAIAREFEIPVQEARTMIERYVGGQADAATA